MLVAPGTGPNSDQARPEKGNCKMSEEIAAAIKLFQKAQMMPSENAAEVDEAIQLLITARRDDQVNQRIHAYPRFPSNFDFAPTFSNSRTDRRRDAVERHPTACTPPE